MTCDQITTEFSKIDEHFIAWWPFSGLCDVRIVWHVANEWEFFKINGWHSLECVLSNDWWYPIVWKLNHVSVSPVAVQVLTIWIWRWRHSQWAHQVGTAAVKSMRDATAEVMLFLVAILTSSCYWIILTSFSLFGIEKDASFCSGWVHCPTTLSCVPFLSSI